MTLLLLSVGLWGCLGSNPSDTASVPAPPQPAMTPSQSAVAPPEIGLIPLPSVRQVQQEAPGGRVDPFGPLSGGMMVPSVQGDADGADSSPGLVLTGVLTVGGQTRALVGFGDQSGEVCVGPGGRCSADSPFVLPSGWSVLSIDANRGCVQLAQNSQPLEPLCIA